MDRYSRFVAWLKVLLPLIGLGLLSALFLLSRSFNPVVSIPFAESEIKERVQNQRVTALRFAGMTKGGDRVLITAATMLTGSETGNRAEELRAQIDLASGTRVVLASDTGSLDLNERLVRLEGSVVITTSSGFEMQTDQLTANFDTLAVASPGPVSGGSPFGRLTAGNLRLTRLDLEESAHLVFTNGVNLIYVPRRSKE